MAVNSKYKRRQKIKAKYKHLRGNADKMRLCVYRSNSHIYASLINDVENKTITTVSSYNKSFEKLNKSDKSKKVGALIAEKAKSLGIENIIFDRNGFKYHGRIKELAEAVREAGLKF